MTEMTRGDVTELVIGACVLAFPVAVTEEVWNLSEQISILRVVLIAAMSCVFVSFFVYYKHRVEDGDTSFRLDTWRVVTTYGVTLLVCATILALLDKFPLASETAVALKRVVLVAFPASFSATVVDSLK